MDTRLRYLQDAQSLEFKALVTQVNNLPDGRARVILKETYFYPTGGGQGHDTGWIGRARVVDVFKDEQSGLVIHLVEGEAAPGEINARIDAERRQRHTQHHTAQHLLSQCFIQLFNLETLSANINGYSPSSIDLPALKLDEDQLNQVEDLANRLIYEDRQVKSYFISPDRLGEVPLRKPPAVSEDIRVVEIEGFDYSSCGGTHCQSTGMIGIVKIQKVEKMKGASRVHFTAGLQSLELFRIYQEAALELAAQMSVAPLDLLASYQRMSEQLKTAQKAQKELEQIKIKREADSLYSKSIWVGSIRLILEIFDDRPSGELRSLADMLKGQKDLVSILISNTAGKITMVVTSGEVTGQNASVILENILSSIGGRGGGDAKLAQGGGVAEIEDVIDFINQIRGQVKALLTKSK